MTLTDAAMKRVREIAAAATYDLHDRSVADLHDVENAIRAALADPVLRGWIPVGEMLPEKYACVIVSGGCGYYDGKCWWTYLESPPRPIEWTVTHWMPLPPPPEGK